MDVLEGKSALITGGASGIGLAMAEAFAGAGMDLVLVDVDEAALAAAGERLGTTTHVCDVTDVGALEALADAVGEVAVVCPNAGVAPVGPTLELSRKDWEWLLGVNLHHVIHLTRLLGPRLVAQGDGHLVFTASGAGLMAVPTLGPYCATKHAVVGLAETLYTELLGTGVGVSVVCPGLVRTGIFASERNRPDRFGGPEHEDAELQQTHQQMLDAGGMDPSVVGEQVLDAVRTGRFWVLPHPELVPFVEARVATIVNGTNPGGLPIEQD
jgi:NAD(P)-dependent dehydrogenase (short-subunit alcohol dehydrogenase family)